MDLRLTYVVVDLGGCELEEAMLRGYIAAGRIVPRPTEVKTTEGKCRIDFAEGLSSEQLAELVRVLGASSKGDTGLTLLEPSSVAGQIVVPAEKSGPQRWDCPRCNRSVMAGANDTPGAVYGICRPCHDTEMKLSGGRTLGTPGLSGVAMAAAAIAPVTGIGRPVPIAPATTGSAAPATEDPQTGRFLLYYVADSIAELPKPEPGYFAIVGERFAYATATAWRVLEGVIPPVC
jgi:hypothetical protein